MYRVNRGCVTVIGYMLGVSEYVLERDYVYDYEKLKMLPFLDDISVVRSLSKLRQNIFKNYKDYKGKNLIDVTNTYVDEDLLFLKEKGYDFFNVSRLDNSIEYLLNAIKKDMDSLIQGVLSKLNMSHPQELKNLFIYPLFDKKSLLNFVSNLKGRALPHGVIVPKYKKLQSSLQYLLSNDTTLYASAFSLSNKEFSVESVVIKPFNWGALVTEDAMASDDVIDDGYVDYEKKFETILEPIIGDEPLSIANTVSTVNVMPLTPVFRPTVANSISAKGYVKNHLISSTVGVVDGCTKYFVDCDNIDFFKFLSMLDTLESEGVKDKTFYLYIDLKATYLWGLLEDIRSNNNSNFNFVYRKVDRVKGNKSVVDVVITVDICKEVMQNGTKKIGLISSDSDFYGVLTTVEADFVVGYNSECTSGAYLQYLSKNDYTKFDIKVFEKEESLINVIDKIVTYLTLSILSTVAMLDWEVELLTESVRGSIQKESSFTIDDIYLEAKISSVLKDMRVSVDDSIVTFSSGDISVKVKK